MPGTVNIPLTTLPPGTYNFGPASVGDTDTGITITLDRTVTNGFNSQPFSTNLWMSAYQSNDGGNTWVECGGGRVDGGVFKTRAGVTINSADVETSLIPGTGRLILAQIIVSGTSVAVQGTLTVS